MLKMVSILAVFLFSTSDAFASLATIKAVVRACRLDEKQYCGDILPGSGRIKACMKSHLQQLSEPCKEALFQYWLND